MMRARWMLLVTCAATFVGFGACAKLPEQELGVCGNNVWEPSIGEDCDGVTSRHGPGVTCGDPTSTAPCRFTCSRSASTSGCPSGWGCGVDGICREPSSELQLGSLPGHARAVGDLDGDGRDDVVMSGSAGEAQIAFFTEGRNIAALFADPARRPISDNPVVQPFVARLTSDGIDDLVLPLVGDDLALRVFMGSASRELDNPFVELVTVPFGATGEVWMRTVFNPSGLPESICAIGGCPEALLLGKTKADETRYAVLEDRTLVELFRLADGHKRQNAALARWDQSRTCDLLAVSYRRDVQTDSPGNRIDLFSLCGDPGSLNQASEVDPLGTVPPLTTVSVAGLDPELSLIVSGSADIDGDGRPDLLLNITDNDPETPDDPQTYALYGSGDGHFNSRADQTGLVDLADPSDPFILGHSFASSDDPSVRLTLPTWPRALADINTDGRADVMLNAGVVAISTPKPQDTCSLAGETVLRGPALGDNDEPQWGYVCLVVSDHGLLDASTAARSEMTRDWLSSGSLATALDLRGDGRLGFAAIDKNKREIPGAETDHSGPDFLDLLWFDPSSAQLTLQSMTAERIEHVAAGDLDGDFAVDLVVGGHKLETIWGAPFELSRATSLSPADYDVVQVFNEGRPSASLGAERGGRLTIFRDGQWPSLALINPGECEQAKDCHVRAAVGALGDPDNFGWALGVVQSSHDNGLRLLRSVSGEADIGPAYDAASRKLLPLEQLGFDPSLSARSATVIAAELDGPDGSGDGTTSGPRRDEALVIARTGSSLQLVVLRPSLVIGGTGKLCSEPFTLAAEPGSDPSTAAVCWEVGPRIEIPSQARPLPGADDPFVELADTDNDGNLDLSWVTNSNTVMLLRGDGLGSFDADGVIEFVFEEQDDEDDDASNTIIRLDWVRWLELEAEPASTPGLRELIAGDSLNAGRLWTLDADFDDAELHILDAEVFDAVDEGEIGYRGDFDGDGIEDLALGQNVLFGQPIND